MALRMHTEAEGKQLALLQLFQGSVDVGCDPVDGSPGGGMVTEVKRLTRGRHDTARPRSYGIGTRRRPFEIDSAAAAVRKI